MAINYCIANGILKEYLKKRASEVLSMLFEEIKAEDLKDVWYKDGMLDGMLQKAIDSAKKLLKKGYPAEDIADSLDLPLSKVLELAKQ